MNSSKVIRAIILNLSLDSKTIYMHSETCDDIDSSDGFKSIVPVIVAELCERFK